MSPQSRLYLLPTGLTTAEIVPLPLVHQPGGARVDEGSSPVLEVTPARVSGREMRSGRLYLGLSPSSVHYRAAKRLYDALKRHTDSWARTTLYDVRVGSHAADQARLGELVLKSNIGEPLTMEELKKP